MAMVTAMTTTTATVTAAMMPMRMTTYEGGGDGKSDGDGDRRHRLMDSIVKVVRVGPSDKFRGEPAKGGELLL